MKNFNFLILNYDSINKFFYLNLKKLFWLKRLTISFSIFKKDIKTVSSYFLAFKLITNQKYFMAPKNIVELTINQTNLFYFFSLLDSNNFKAENTLTSHNFFNSISLLVHSFNFIELKKNNFYFFHLSDLWIKIRFKIGHRLNLRLFFKVFGLS